MGYRLIRIFVSLIVRLMARLTVIGLENAPLDANIVIASNHIGRLDAFLIYTFTKRQDVIMMVAEKYRENRVLSWLADRMNVVWVDRFNADFGAVRTTLNRLKNGGILVLAPEGTRSPNGVLQEGRPGAGYLASRAGVPIVPIALIGSDDAIVRRNLRRLKRTPITARVGKSFTLPPIPTKDRELALRSYTDEMMCRIAALLPPERRGFYADHSRLKELLDEDAAPTEIHAG